MRKTVISKKFIVLISIMLLFSSLVLLTGCGSGKKGKDSEIQDETTKEVVVVDNDNEKETTKEKETEKKTEDTTESSVEDETDETVKESETEASTEASTKAPATETPTKAPATETPTKAPATEAPTEAPTKVPATQAPTQAPTQEPETEEKFELDSSYSLVWMDEFEGSELDLNNWSYEEHEPGWVNSELQKYVASENNIYLNDGKLVIQPIKTVAENGDVSYTSGRINSQNKQTFKYGYFECRAKVPTGAGFLPAFWMMPNDENLYGQWPKCGEIDIMEVMGQQTNKLYGTIHFGEPHSESQGTKILSSGNFADSFHTFACEWEPGVIRWYVDGVLFHEENDWYSTTKNVGTVTYPAPFDQPFYLIFNVAVGGSWVGNVDDSTPFDERAQLVVDYVKVYQKAEYDENVEKPVKEVILRDPDSTGNYVNNGKFTVSENLTDDINWKFMTANGGNANASILNNIIQINTTNEGSVDYSVQLVQANIPLKKGAKYKLSFEAKAEENRNMNTAIKAPDRGYSAYISKNTSLTTDWSGFEYEFTMEEDSDANARLEYNMGAAGSTAAISIRNVRIEMTQDAIEGAEPAKKVLANGSLVYNGGFQEGADRLAFWNVSDKNVVSVTNINNIRELLARVNHAEGNPIVVTQTGLAFTDNVKYELSFDARAASGNVTVKVTVAGETEEFVIDENNDNSKYTYKITNTTYTNKDIKFEIFGNGTLYLDDVKIVEDSLIKNGSFNAGLSGFELYKYSDGLASIVVDSLTENNAADITINSTGDADNDWYIQLKQNNVVLEKDKWYRFTFKVKSNKNRKFKYAIQKDGSSDNDWTPYVEGTIELAGDGEYETITKEFKASNTDIKSILSFTMGSVGNVLITDRHRICIDDIVLEEIDAPVVTPDPEEVNMLTGLYTLEGSTATSGNVEGKYTFNFTSSGVNSWDQQLAMQNLALVNGATYKVAFKVKSDIARKIQQTVRIPSGNYPGDYNDITLEAGVVKEFEKTFVWEQDTTTGGEFAMLLGTPDGADAYGAHILEIYDVSLVMVSQAVDAGLLTGYERYVFDGCGTISSEGNKDVYSLISSGTEDWHAKAGKNNLTLEEGKKYRLSFKITSSIDRKVKAALVDNSWDGEWRDINLTSDEAFQFNEEITWQKPTANNNIFNLALGKIDDLTYGEHTIVLEDLSLVEVTE